MNTKKIIFGLLAGCYMFLSTAAITNAIGEGANFATNAPTLLEAVINSDTSIEVQKSTIFDASQSFIPDAEKEYKYEWDFGDGNKNEGVEVLHVYKNPGNYKVTLNIENEEDQEQSVVSKEIFAYNKLILLLTDSEKEKLLIENQREYAKQFGVHVEVLDSYGSASQFISEEVFTKKITEASQYVKRSQQIVVWTKDNTGLNALSRFNQENKDDSSINLSQKSITVLVDNVDGYSTRVKRQFQAINPKNIILANEAGLHLLIENFTSTEFIEALQQKGYEHEVITESSYKLRPWNFISYFINILTEKGIPDNTIALLLLLPVIATVVAFIKQVIGLTTMGIYTPTIITLSFLIIGLYFGLFTLLSILVVGGVTRSLLKNVRLLFIPKMAIVMVLVSLTLILILIASVTLGIFDATFFSLAVFPMVILSTLVEKFVSIKTEKGLVSAVTLMSETIAVSIIAFLVVGGTINLGFGVIEWGFVKNLMLDYPELIFVLIGINILLGRWSGLRLLEFIRFREVLRHIEE